MESLYIYFKSLAGTKTKEQVLYSTKIKEIKTRIAQQKSVQISQISLRFKNKDLEDEKTIQQEGLRHGDEITLMIKKGPAGEKNNAPIQCAKKLDENFIKQFQELKELGYNEQNIQEALNSSNNDFQRALCLLAQQSENPLEEEVQQETPTYREIYKSLLKDPIVKELRNRVYREDEWNKTIQTIKHQNNEIYQLISQNEEEFRHLIIEDQTNKIIIDENDLGILMELRQFKPQMSDKELLNAYIKYNKIEFDTIEYLDEL